MSIFGRNKHVTGEELNNRRRQLVEGLIRHGYVRSKKVKDAISSVPREMFLPEKQISSAYYDTPQPIGSGQTISAPHMVAIMCEELKLKKGHKVLEIGGGMGYHAAVAASIVGPEGSVISIEIVDDLARRAMENIARAGFSNTVKVIFGDGVQKAKDNSPYDRIYTAAASPDISKVLLECLNPGGIILMPVGRGHFCQLIRYSKLGSASVESQGSENVKKEVLGACSFVPLRGEFGWD